jgi:RNA polymerase sigma-70 factor (ECF subfamily)
VPADAVRLDAARRGDRTAFASIYEELYPKVYRFAYFHSHSAADAEDAAAEAFLRALEHIRGFRGTADQFPGWVMRIARNVIIDRARSTRRTAQMVADPVGPDPATDADDRVVLRQALGRLREEQRSVLVLRFLVGLSAREVGAAMAKTEGAVEQLQHRGLASLARELGETREGTTR